MTVNTSASKKVRTSRSIAETQDEALAPRTLSNSAPAHASESEVPRISDKNN